MNRFSAESTAIEGLKRITPFSSEDERGRFVKDYSRKLLEQDGIAFLLKEVFYTYSKKGTIRALHFQREKQQQKLVRCVNGKIFDVVVDLRKDSPTFKEWISFELSGENNVELLIPAGLAHGYLVLEESIVSYKCDEDFYGEFDDGIIWNDGDIGVDWPLSGIETLILSEKDKTLQTFAEFIRRYGTL
jgi:dTDP-4-dehydrorhamnose 3,5-epimerase